MALRPAAGMMVQFYQNAGDRPFTGFATGGHVDAETGLVPEGSSLDVVFFNMEAEGSSRVLCHVDRPVKHRDDPTRIPAKRESDTCFFDYPPVVMAQVMVAKPRVPKTRAAKQEKPPEKPTPEPTAPVPDGGGGLDLGPGLDSAADMASQAFADAKAEAAARPRE